MPNWNSNNQSNHPQGPPNGGDLWWNSDVGQLMVWNGLSWVPLNPPGAAVNASLGMASQDGNTLGQGFTYLSVTDASIGGTPQITGSTNMGAAVFDVVHNRLWVYNGSVWKSAVLA